MGAKKTMNANEPKKPKHKINRILLSITIILSLTFLFLLFLSPFTAKLNLNLLWLTIFFGLGFATCYIIHYKQFKTKQIDIYDILKYIERQEKRVLNCVTPPIIEDLAPDLFVIYFANESPSTYKIKHDLGQFTILSRSNRKPYKLRKDLQEDDLSKSFIMREQIRKEKLAELGLEEDER